NITDTDLAESVGLPANTELDIKVMDDPSVVVDLKKRVLDFLNVYEENSTYDSVNIIDVEFSLVCAGPPSVDQQQPPEPPVAPLPSVDQQQPPEPPVAPLPSVDQQQPPEPPVAPLPSVDQQQPPEPPVAPLPSVDQQQPQEPPVAPLPSVDQQQPQEPLGPCDEGMVYNNTTQTCEVVTDPQPQEPLGPCDEGMV
ncbi:MAG: hypothetical protein AB7U98_12360, partial [Candidatus Nitrosocosmicus sp.]